MKFEYDLAYYSGEDMVYPTRPVRPAMPKSGDSHSIREYADVLEEYEKLLATYEDGVTAYRTEQVRRIQQLKQVLADDYDITPRQCDLIWDWARMTRDGENLNVVLETFDDIYEIVVKFHNAE